MQGPWRSSTYWIAVHALFSLLFHTIQGHLSKGGTTSVSWALPYQRLVKKTHNRLAYRQILGDYFLYWDYLFPKYSSMCQVDIKRTRTPADGEYKWKATQDHLFQLFNFHVSLPFISTILFRVMGARECYMMSGWQDPRKHLRMDSSFLKPLPLGYICLHWEWGNKNINKQIYLQDVEDPDILGLLCIRVCVMGHVWCSKDSFQELVLSFHHEWGSLDFFSCEKRNSKFILLQ